MNFFYRAFLNVKGKKGRTILLILVLSAILLFVLAGIIIQNAATTAVNNAKKSSGATVTLSANRSNAFKKLRQQKSKNPTLSLASVSVKTAKKIGNSDYVKAYNITNSTSVNAKSFDAIKTSSSSQSNQMSGPGGKSSSSSSSSQGDISLSGVTSTSQVSSFTSGTSKIKSGRGINASDAGTNNVVIETELAKQNSISVGDTITVKDTDKNIHKFKVVGIYKSSSTSSQTGGMGQTDPSNTIYSSYALVNSIKGTTSAESVTYTISNPSKAAAFITAAKKSINTSKLSLTKDDSTYRSLLTPLNNVKSFAQKIVILVSVAGTIILTLIVVLMIRERRYEIGVLLSLGEKRWKVIAQFFAEMVMIMVVSIAVAGAGGKFVGDAVGKQLVNQTTTTTSTTTNTTTGNSQNGQPGGGGAQMANNGGGGQQQSTQASSQQLQKLSTSISVVSLVQLGAFGLAIILLAILIGSIGILRLQPKKILIS
ncbi:ABC transporter permease [Liquorilactobacillus satsumensis]|uniref:ABC transporter permease n=1 Tax=Liquorilactobacillus satsumensis TaxID=259059 RepID=UPI001E4AA2C1|nr:ABC transporter permease [Liquorilactobacillus satsumensis]MCC7666026.1 ABC transporter permease [Liquorilactobacillus satsumensis]MCP9313072.1 ABC transporter permease [Liquorilactobacillus satsumensis]MCP9356869.1 ABC transporter permease [Liquorilactobacillus satsumensis]MCP9360228.1 ABC transporter permease [Liquorilactobacillus satsumensis]MCP9370809.1 ABC transporter permease [Liquorilactobacillus satsumensis]